MENDKYPFVNLPLPYEKDALEPYIDTKTMEIHHDRQLQSYIDRLNETLKDYPVLQSMTLEELIINADRFLEQGLQEPLQNYGGGVYNHRFYFDGMAEPTNLTPRGRLIDMIEAQYGNFNNFIQVLKYEGLKVFGSGYAWLVFDNGILRIITMPNQNAPITLGYCPILALDVWEHAYFLKHYNLRANYIDDWFRVINWEKANEKYLDCLMQQQEVATRRINRGKRGTFI